MKLSTIAEQHTFSNGTPFYTDFPAAKTPETPIITAKAAQRLTTAYHASIRPDLDQTGISTRQTLGLPDLFKQGLDSTHQDAVYLAVSPEVLKFCTAPGRNQNIYQIDVSKLDRSKFIADEDAVGHCVISGDNLIDSMMCMGTFRYQGNIPAGLITRLR